jgi:hypothetical protein
MNVENHAAAVVGVLGVFQRESQVGIGQHFIELGNIGIRLGGKYDNRPEKKFQKLYGEEIFFPAT